ncbi:MAG: type II secretion system F family protein [Acidimicrobiales bacterium]|jgi:Flp pilus assembly protein TadB
MSRVLLLCGLIGWAGATLLLSQLRWFRRLTLVERLRPYAPGQAGAATATTADALSLRALREVVEPLFHELAEQLSRLFGVSEELATRLERIHSPHTVADFRARQLGWSLAAFSAGGVIALSTGMPAALAVLFLLGSPLLTFLLLEQQVISASGRWQRALFHELPVVGEQLGMLLSAGYSLGAALNRIASRGHGCCARDLARVCGRIRQGLAETDALEEWADLAGVDAVNRLVGVLALNRDGGDLGRLIAQEARAIRRDVQRELIEAVERRAQQVWIPVTVATLVPGVLFLTVPFVEAMRLFTAG